MNKNGGEFAAFEVELHDLLKREMAERGGEGMDGMLRTLRDTLEQLDYCGKILGANGPRLSQQHPPQFVDALGAGGIVACAGVAGAYAHIAARQIFGEPEMLFLRGFEDVVTALGHGEVSFGILPVENSSAGQVTEVLELAANSGFFISCMTQIKCEHCLCAKRDLSISAIDEVLSHPQALAQCRHFLREHGLTPRDFSNTAAAAQHVAENDGNFACICSREGAERYGLTVLQSDIQDFEENYTRFICVGREHLVLPDADTVAITLSFPNEPGVLAKLLTRFAACDLDLARIQSMPIASRDFDVRFHLDFKGNLRDEKVDKLLGAMSAELSFFRYLGNYRSC